MKSVVHILATVRKPELLPAALLVFRTLRTGFPTTPVCVWGNGLDPASERAVVSACQNNGCRFQNLPATQHDMWFEALIEENLEPFWICDTDMVFWSAVEDWFSHRPEVALAGRHEIEFNEEWTNTLHMERLHTCLMFVRPGLLRTAMRTWMSRIPLLWRSQAEFPFVRQHFVPALGQAPRFYDTAAGLWQAGIGTPFSETENAAFDHLHCGTYADEIKLGGGDLRVTHNQIYAQPGLARGLRQQQNIYYDSRRPRPVETIAKKGNHAIRPRS